MIISFSGTGNSYWVAEQLRLRLGEETLIRLEREWLLSDGERSVNNDSDDRCIWIFPVYSWGVPPVVRKFIENFEFVGKQPSVHHLVLTCGDDVGLTHLEWKKLIENKDCKTGVMCSVQMPNTYTLMKGFDVDSEKLEIEKLKNAEKSLDVLAGLIVADKRDVDVTKGSFPTIKSRIINPWFKRFAMSPKPFYADDRCISCGLCEEKCPTANIKLLPHNDLNARPHWGMNCALCLRCYHHCPANSIQYGKATQGKGQYQIEKVIRKL